MLFVGCSLAYAGFRYARAAEDSSLASRFGRACEARAATIESALDSRLLALDAIYAYVDSRDSVDQNGLEHFAAPLFERVAEVEALAWLPRVAGGDRVRFEETLSAEQGDALVVTNLDANGRANQAGTQDEFYPIASTFPVEPNRTLIGLNMLSEPSRARALRRALTSGEAAATGPLPSLVARDDEAEAQPGPVLTVFVPIFDAYARRGRRPRGAVMGVFRVSDMIREALRHFSEDITVRVYDVTTPTDRRLLWAGGDAEAEAPFRRSQTLAVGGRTWLVTGDAGPDYLREGHTGSPWSVLLGGVLASVLLCAYVSIGIRRARLIDNLARDLDRMSREDPLTGIANRRVFDLRLRREWQQSTRNGAPLSLLMIDIDHFKRFNDSLGHQAGDACLRQVAQVLGTTAARSTDLPARYGGEEFAVVLPTTDEGGAEQVAKTILYRVRRLEVAHPDSATAPYVTISIGVATMVATAAKAESELIKAADRALYRAKKQGRDRVVVAVPDDTLDSAS
ncbi:MAG: diguanylate cyclase [Myxococcales bacterium]|nr:diguanylate cyclase [Myxococcales bacterium]MCB9627085.1 diguanylate cyclase [Sandaracinaceae bacterium]